MTRNTDSSRVNSVLNAQEKSPTSDNPKHWALALVMILLEQSD